MEAEHTSRGEEEVSGLGSEWERPGNLRAKASPVSQISDL